MADAGFEKGVGERSVIFKWEDADEHNVIANQWLIDMAEFVSRQVFILLYDVKMPNKKGRDSPPPPGSASDYTV